MNPRTCNIKIGKKYGQWTVVRMMPKGTRRRPCYECYCKCGILKIHHGHSLAKLQDESSCHQCAAQKRRSANPDLSGKRIGRILIIEKSGNGIGSDTNWVAQCDCGTKLILNQKRINAGKSSTRSCGCTSIEFLRKNKHKGPGVSAINQLFERYKLDAKNREISFSLTKEEFIKITNLDCYYCGIVPQQKCTHKWGTFYYYNGIDRVDNSKGYDIDNCTPCCKGCNTKKLSIGIDLAIKVLDLLKTGNPYKRP